MAPISAEWNVVGMALGVDPNFLAGLQNGPNFQNVVKMDKVIHQWLITNTQDHVKWKEVIAAMEGVIYYNKHIADNIRKYLTEQQ